MAIGNLIYSTSSTTIVTGDAIEASDFERSTNLQVDNTSGNINISGGINTAGISTFGATINVTGNVTLSGNVNTAGITNSGTANLGAVGSVKITGGSNGYILRTDGSSNLSWVDIGSSIATLVPGVIGSYALLQPVPDASYDPGNLVSGNDLRYSGIYTDGAGNSGYATGDPPPGTWQAMGKTRGGFGRTITLWLRVS